MTPFSVEFVLEAWGFMMDFLQIVHRGAHTPYRTVQTFWGNAKGCGSKDLPDATNSGGPFSAQTLGTSRGWLGCQPKTGCGPERVLVQVI